MKTAIKLLAIIAIIAVIGFSMAGCDKDDNNNDDDNNNEETASVPQPKTITQDNGLAFDGKVTISTSDLYLNADWDAVVANVITAFNAAYTDPTAPGPVKGQFETAFANNANAQIVLVNNLANNWEVRDGEFRTLYLKTSSIATVVYRNAVQRMLQSTPSVGKATPAKHRVFLG
ncbi:MAG: hypothetical protein LBQ82_01650 [Treponema sp.]|jgi:hypothetical protein|nr:hypothetical protein [Treponema sp.]